MRRHATAAAVAALLAAPVCVLSAQVAATQEPHHHVVLYTDDLRILDVTIPPGEAAAEHSHEHDVATVMLGGTRTKPAGTVDIAAIAGTRTVYRIENADAQPYHVVEVENLRGREFTIYDVRFDSAKRTASHTHVPPTVAVLIDGAVENSGNGGETPARLQRPGRWLLIARGQSHNLEATGTGDAHIVEIEVR
jgi:quercetin dioxygenase-like cupin family protein